MTIFVTFSVHVRPSRKNRTCSTLIKLCQILSILFISNTVLCILINWNDHSFYAVGVFMADLVFLWVSINCPHIWAAFQMLIVFAGRAVLWADSEAEIASEIPQKIAAWFSWGWTDSLLVLIELEFLLQKCMSGSKLLSNHIRILVLLRIWSHRLFAFDRKGSMNCEITFSLYFTTFPQLR